MMENAKNRDNRIKRYNEIFPDEKSKAEAFDMLAQEYYLGNFGQMSKAETDVIMFHLYIKQLLNVKGDADFTNYSDYVLAKDLGITQSKVSSLKLKQQLQYPIEYKWQDSLARISSNVRYENGKFKLLIPDINLFYEIKNAVETNGGYIDITLTPKLLQISPEFFFDLMIAISEEKERTQLRKKIRAELRKQREDLEFLEAEPISKRIKKLSAETIMGLISAVGNAAIGNVVGTGTSFAVIAGNFVKAFSDSNE